jgi:hypothetical protein
MRMLIHCLSVCFLCHSGPLLAYGAGCTSITTRP